MAITTSILTGGSNSHTTTSEEVNYHATDFFSPGVTGVITNTAGVAPTTGSFSINAQGSPNMTVAVGTGAAYVTATPSGGNSQRLRIKNSASANVTIAANVSGGTRFDWLYLSVDATKAATPAVDASDVTTLVTSRSTSATTDNGTPPTYGTLLAVVTVANGAATIVNGNIADKRVRANEVGGLNDDNGNEIAKITSTASAVNELTFANAATGNAPTISSTGDDTNIDLKLTPKGTGRVVLNGAGAPTSALVATSETTGSTSFTDLATPGPAVTVTIGTSGIALVILSASLSNGTLGDYAVMGFAASGTNTIAASSTRALFKKAEAAGNDTQATWAYLATGLTAGSTTFTAKYECLIGGTSTFVNRNIAVIPF